MYSLCEIRTNPFNLQNGTFVEPKQYSHIHKKSSPTTNFLNCSFVLQKSCQSTCYICKAHPSLMMGITTDDHWVVPLKDERTLFWLITLMPSYCLCSLCGCLGMWGHSIDAYGSWESTQYTHSYLPTIFLHSHISEHKPHIPDAKE